MEKYREDQLWKSMVDSNNEEIYDTCIDNINVESKCTDVNNELFDDDDISNISFSLDNEKILEKINGIIDSGRDIEDNISLKILKNQNLMLLVLQNIFWVYFIFKRQQHKFLLKF